MCECGKSQEAQTPKQSPAQPEPSIERVTGKADQEAFKEDLFRPDGLADGDEIAVEEGESVQKFYPMDRQWIEAKLRDQFAKWPNRNQISLIDSNAPGTTYTGFRLATGQILVTCVSASVAFAFEL